MAQTVFTPALEGIKQVKTEEGDILTKPFLDSCKHILPVIDKFGDAMALVKSDIGGNITVAMKLAPDRNKFMEVLGGDAVKCDIEPFLTTFTPLLQQNHKFLASMGLDDLKAS